MNTLDRREFFGLAGIVIGAALLEGCALKNAALTQTLEPTLEPTQAAAPSSTPNAPKIELANRYIAYCGNNCERCSQYKKECPSGCLGETCSVGCGRCSVRRCAIKNIVENCAYCDQYPCKTLEDQYSNMDAEGYGSWAKSAKRVLEAVKQTL
ncbi:MAG: hypothetical protein CVU42_09015 [Chloroflexi bacterium HGW-Chloroflexi-4]|nr:MAG: hypothetical protein CVU45_01835 [Chloroflexi bacterium HGW-Chloroflexi-7]PKN98999.1 MAG: hypothetical protein CVU42_09015 [Chloroflexi bacterium HGW-Chloroflexi-4]